MIWILSQSTLPTFSQHRKRFFQPSGLKKLKSKKKFLVDNKRQMNEKRKSFKASAEKIEFSSHISVVGR